MNIIKGKLHRAQRVVIYGQEGVGKTTLAAGFPRPLILDTEDGSHHLNVDRVPIGCLAALQTALDELQDMAFKGTCAYATIVIDTADHLWNMCADAICDEMGWDSIEKPGYGKGYIRASERFVSLFGKLDALVRLGLHVVILCHAKILRVSPPDNAEFTKFCIKVNAPSTQAETAREYLKEWCDALLFCRFKIAVDDEKKRAIGETAARCICTSSAPQWESKNRAGLADELPMSAAALAPLFTGEAPKVATTAPVEVVEVTPVDLTPARGAAAVPPSGSAPAELGFSPKSPAEAPMPVSEAPASAPAASAAPAQPAPAPSPTALVRGEGESYFFPEEKAVLIEFLVAHKRLQPGQTLNDLAPNVKRALHARPYAALKQAQDWKDKTGKEGQA